MSINSDVMDDIEDAGVVDNDIIKQPSSVNPTTKPLDIVVKTSDVPLDVTQLTEADKEKLPTLDISFKLIHDNVAKVVELEDVENDIIAQECINRSNVKFVDEVFEGLLGNSIRLEEFTHHPSKTNFIYVKNYMRNKISLEHNNITTAFIEFVHKPLNDAKAILDKLSECYLDNCTDRVNDLVYNYKDLESKLKTNKDLVVQYKGNFTNLTAVDLFQIDYNDISLNIANKEILNKATGNIKQLFESKLFKAFMFGSIDGKTVPECISTSCLLEYGDRSITILDLTKFFSNNIISDNIGNFKNIVENNIKTIETICEQYSKDVVEDNYVMVNEFVVSKNNEVQTMIKSIQDICKLVLNTNNLTLNASVLLDFYKKF